MHVLLYATTLKRITDNTDQPKLHVQHRTGGCITSVVGHKFLQFSEVINTILCSVLG
jgi:hypothetical protein